MEKESIAPAANGRELEVVDHAAIGNLNEDKMAAILRLAEKSDELGKALDKIRTFALQRALPGDWVLFAEKDKETGQMKEGNLELTGAGADRIAAALGISFIEWRDWKESSVDKNGEQYSWWYQCTVIWGGRTIEGVQGRAGTRDLFFGYAYGAFKDLGDIKEADIRTAARRNCMKEGVKLALGLRRIPENSAPALGLDKNKIRGVTFGGKGQTTSHKPDAADSGGKVVVIARVEVSGQSKAGDKKTWKRYRITSKDGLTFSTFDDALAKQAGESADRQEKVSVFYDSDPKYGLQLKAIRPAPAEKEPEPAGDAQEPA